MVCALLLNNGTAENVNQVRRSNINSTLKRLLKTNTVEAQFNSERSFALWGFQPPFESESALLNNAKQSCIIYIMFLRQVKFKPGE